MKKHFFITSTKEKQMIYIKIKNATKSVSSVISFLKKYDVLKTADSAHALVHGLICPTMTAWTIRHREIRSNISRKRTFNDDLDGCCFVATTCCFGVTESWRVLAAIIATSPVIKDCACRILENLVRDLECHLVHHVVLGNLVATNKRSHLAFLFLFFECQ